MKVVVDTNIVISGIIWGGVPGEILTHIIESDDSDWLASAEILREYEAVLARPRFGLAEPLLRRWSAVFTEETTLVEHPPVTQFTRDHTDAKFLACAIAAEADFLITGDRDFSQAQLAGATKIVSSAQFKRLVIGRS